MDIDKNTSIEEIVKIANRNNVISGAVIGLFAFTAGFGTCYLASQAEKNKAVSQVIESAERFYSNTKNGFHYDLNSKFSEDTFRFEDFYKKRE